MHQQGRSVLTQSYRTLPSKAPAIPERFDYRHNTYSTLGDIRHRSPQPYFVHPTLPLNQFKSALVDRSTETEADLLEELQAQLSAKFTLMLQVHKEGILDLLYSDNHHDLHLKKLTHELTELRLHNARLQLENRYLQDLSAKHN